MKKAGTPRLISEIVERPSQNFSRDGARLMNSSCAACVNAGPGASVSPEQVMVSAQNLNFPGRSGLGQIYLASPYVVAASAVAGRIVEPSHSSMIARV